MVVRGRSWSVGSNSLRMVLGNSECEEELARRLWMVSGEPDRKLGARPCWTNDSESGRLSVAGFCSNQRWTWIRAFRCSWFGGLSCGCRGGDLLREHSYGHRSKRGARKR